MRALSHRAAWLLLAVLLLAAPSIAKKKTKKKKRRNPAWDAPIRTEQERLCDSCMRLADHATKAIAQILSRKEERAKKLEEEQVIDWPGVVEKGCYGDELCAKMMAPIKGAVAEELAAIVEDVEEAGAGMDQRQLPNLLCAPKSMTRACPPKLYKEPAGGMDSMTTFTVALWNGRTVDSETMGDVEVHLVAPHDQWDKCAVTERVKGEARFEDRNVRRLRANEEQMFSLAIATLNPRVPTLRVKKVGAPCGDGVDLDVNVDEDKWAVWEVVDNKKHDAKKPSTIISGQDNRPLLVNKLPGRDARAMLDKSHKFWDEL